MQTLESKTHYSIPSIIALVAAVASFFVSAGSGFLLAMVAIVFGILGFVLSLSPSVRGGVVSVFSLFLAGIGIVVAIIRALTHV